MGPGLYLKYSRQYYIARGKCPAVIVINLGFGAKKSIRKSEKARDAVFKSWRLTAK